MSDSARATEASAPGCFGPWVPHLADDERRARWRSLAALAMVYAGGAHPLLRACIAAEGDPAAALAASAALESLAPLVRRRLLAAYAALAEMHAHGNAGQRQTEIGAAP